MMLYYCIFAVVVLLLWYFLWRWYMMMFQQNSYRPERFLKWLKANPLPRFSRKTKVPFVLTARMKRLGAGCLLLSLVFCALPLVKPSLLWPLPLLALVLTPFLLLLANLINSPLEKAINRHYIEDARRILARRGNLIVIGVTGSYGKTSTKNYLYRILSERYNVLMTPGNYNTLLGVVRTVREQLKPYHEVFIVEMGAKQRGDIKEICDLVHPRYGVVTAVGKMHLETFGSEENVLRTKFELLASLPADGMGFACAESVPVQKALSQEEFACRVVSYGIDAHRCDARAGNLDFSPEGTRFTLVDESGSEGYHTPLFGAGNVLDLCAAILLSRRLGIPEERIAIAVSKLQSVEHRLSVSRRGAFWVIDDAYNSNPDGSKMALELLRRFRLPEGGKRVCVTPGYVELGAQQQSECRSLGRVAAKSCDILVIVNRYNREAILDGALEGGMSRDNILLADSLSAVGGLLSLPSGSVILYENDLPDSFK